MKATEFLRIARQIRKPVLTIGDVSKIINKPAGYTRLFINRIKQKKLVEEIESGKYVLSGTHEYSVASNIVFPSYLSFYTGLRFYDYTTQMPSVSFVACLKSKKQISTKSYKIKFVKLSKKRFFGYKRAEFDGNFVFVAEPEKVIVDNLYIPKYAPVGEVFGAIKEKDYDLKKLLNYASRMKSVVVLKRLGYMLDLSGTDIYKDVKGKLNESMDKLNPNFPEKNPNSKWKIYVNEALE